MIKLWRKIKRICGIFAEVDELSDYVFSSAMNTAALSERIHVLEGMVTELKEKLNE